MTQMRIVTGCDTHKGKRESCRHTCMIDCICSYVDEGDVIL